MRFLLVLPVLVSATSPWPSDGMSQRTSDKVKAAKRAAKFLGCDMCAITLASRVPHEAEAFAEYLKLGKLADLLSDATGLCKMKVLADTLRAARLEVETYSNGTAELKRRAEGVPFYEDINTSDLIFHWKSLAVQHACLEVFRRKGGDAVAAGVLKASESLQHDDSSRDEQEMNINRALYVGCRESRTCKKEVKRRETTEKRGLEL